MKRKCLYVLSVTLLVLIDVPRSEAQSISEKISGWFNSDKVAPVTDDEHDRLREQMSAYAPSAYYRMASATAEGAGVARNLQTAITYGLVAAALADREGDADTASQARKLVDRLHDDVDPPSRRQAEVAAERIVADRDLARRYKNLWEKGKETLDKAMDAVKN